MRWLRWIFVVLLLGTVAVAGVLPACDDPCTSFNEGDVAARLVLLPSHGIRLIRPVSHSEAPSLAVPNWFERVVADRERRLEHEQKPSSTNSLQVFLCTFLI